VRFIAVFRIQIQDLVLFLLLIPGYGIRIRDGKNPGTEINIPIHISESLVRIFGLKIIKFFVVDLDPGTGAFLTPGSGMEKSGFGILDKHSASATLVYFIIHIGTKPETNPSPPPHQEYQ
jgi:hypothetical protein